MYVLVTIVLHASKWKKMVHNEYCALKIQYVYIVGNYHEVLIAWGCCPIGFEDTSEKLVMTISTEIIPTSVLSPYSNG